jgi:hypothetical protein
LEESINLAIFLSYTLSRAVVLYVHPLPPSSYRHIVVVAVTLFKPSQTIPFTNIGCTWEKEKIGCTHRILLIIAHKYLTYSLAFKIVSLNFNVKFGDF